MRNNLSRTRAALLNSSIASIGQIATLVMQFVARTFFIHILGQQYLGLNGLFTNILTFLNFAEMGIGSAITYALYEPLATENRPQIAALMRQFKKWYQYIALIVAIGGIILTPFLPYLVHNQATNFVNVYVAFLLALGNTVASYLVSYKRTLLIANQQGYLNTINTIGYSLVQQIVQVIFLLLYANFYLYLFIQLLFMVISNVHVSHVVDKMYPYLNDYKDERVDGNTLSYFKKNIVGMLSSKVGGIVVNGTDNILLSYFIGLDAVGLYSNYTLILNGLTNVLNQAVTSVASSVGNLAASRGSQEKQKRVFYNYYALSTLLVLFATVGFTAFSSTFIRYWIGSRYIYTQLPLFLISLNFYFQGIRQPVITYTNAYGLYWYARYKSIFESVVNLVVSIVLIKFTGLGISAVLLGTITSNMLVNLWWEPLIVFKWGLKKGYLKFMLLNIIYIIIGVGMLGVIVYSTQIVDYNNILLNIATTAGFELLMFVIFIVTTRLFSADIFNLKSLLAKIKR